MNEPLRDSTQDQQPAPRLGPGSTRMRSSAAPAVRFPWVAYWKPAAGVLLAVVVVVFAAQNADSVAVRFLVWEVGMSQALMVFLAAVFGAVFGVLLGRRWRNAAPANPRGARRHP